LLRIWVKKQASRSRRLVACVLVLNQITDVKIKISDIQGNIVYESILIKSEKLCIPNAQIGMYILSVTLSDGKISTHKLIVQ
jgi:hypothetical protein